MFPKSLQWRLVSFFCIVAFCLIIPIGLYLSDRIENKYYDSFAERLDKGFNYWNIKGDDPSAQELIDELKDSESIFQVSQLENRSYTITDKNGEILETNDEEFLDNPAGALGALLSSDNFVRAMTGESENKRILENYGGRSFFDYARPVGRHILYFRYYKDDWADITSYFNNVIIISAIVALAVAFIAGYLLSKTITVPLGKLMNKARSIAAGDFGQVLEVKSDDEIGKLTETFNYMAVSLKNTLAEISSEKSKMETILNYMTDGVIAFDLDGEIIHTNPASARLLGVDGQIENFQDYCTIYGFKYCLEDVIYLQSKNTTETTIDTGERTIKVYFAVFTDEEKQPEGIIAVLQDITEQDRLEKMRKEFVANVSHELRTPLTSIKSYSETLLDGALEDKEMAERFLSVINSEADRMTWLVRDLLQLSQFDNQQMNWKFEKVSLPKLVKSIVDRMEMEAKARDQILEFAVRGEVPDIEADFGRMEQVIFNLLGNGIKYTPIGGKVSIYVGKIYRDVYFKVVDTGIGIPECDIDRIFERFYRVDKARSREMGGTGLGLAIAKEIIEAHGGTISISSKLGEGTEVMVRMPVKQQKQMLD